MGGLAAIRTVLAAYRTGPAHITQEQAQEAWAGLDQAKRLVAAVDRLTALQRRGPAECVALAESDVRELADALQGVDGEG